MKLPLQSVAVEGPDGFEATFEVVAAERADTLYLIDSPEMFTRRPGILEVIRSISVPAAYPRREWADSGRLMAYGVNFGEVHRRAAAYVDKPLKGTSPADLPVEHPMTFDFVINLQTVEALGVPFPPHVLLQATELTQWSLSA
jgi:putative ABC transport system substrate-binding protein